VGGTWSLLRVGGICGSVLCGWAVEETRAHRRVKWLAGESRGTGELPHVLCRGTGINVQQSESRTVHEAVWGIVDMGCVRG
jgi:hypothetical protein